MKAKKSDKKSWYLVAREYEPKYFVYKTTQVPPRAGRADQTTIEPPQSCCLVCSKEKIK